MCTSYESNPKDAFDVFSLFPVPNFEYKPEIYKDYAAPIFRRVDGEYLTSVLSQKLLYVNAACSMINLECAGDDHGA